MYRNLTNGNSSPGYTIKDLNTALRRMEMVSAYFYFFPGPKMIWEFGELGFDYSINYCPDGTINNNCRLEPKPIRWDYYDVMLRRRIYDVSRAMIQLRKQAAWQEGSLTLSVANQFEKKMQMQHADMDIVVAGNFYIGARNIAPGFTKNGWWYDYLSGDSLQVMATDTGFTFLPGEYHVYTTKRLTLGFEITTSIADQVASIENIEVVPAVNRGEFFISKPITYQPNARVYIFSITGEAIPVELQDAGDRIRIKVDVPAGMYGVNLIVGQTLYTGKVIVQ
jgi:hypothetical protein